MKYNPDIHHRRSIRLKGFDYTNPGAYFVTICVQNKECLLGEITDGRMELNVVGKLAQNQWQQLSEFFQHIELDEFQFMPNHIHGIIIINKRLDHIVGVGAKHPEHDIKIDPKNFPTGASPLRNEQKRPNGTTPGSIGAIVQNFCSVTTRKINRISNSKGAKFWQRDYFEHIIRDADEMNRIRIYINENPLKWENDKYYSN